MWTYWPQYAILALMFAGLVIAAGNHGEKKTGRHSFWTTAIAFVVELGLLIAGGFFER